LEDRLFEGNKAEPLGARDVTLVFESSISSLFGCVHAMTLLFGYEHHVTLHFGLEHPMTPLFGFEHHVTSHSG
jgi:hypothetical protein